MAKELLYSQIIETGRFETKDKNGLRADDVAATAHEKHRRALAGELDIKAEMKAIPTFNDWEAQMVKTRWDKLDVYMEYVIDVDLYNYTICDCDGCGGDNDCSDCDKEDRLHCEHSKALPGYHSCSDCPHANIHDTIIHDIAVTTPNYYNHIVYAIEIIHKHFPDWEEERFRPYPTYIIKADSVLRRVENTPVYVERVIL